MKKKAIFFSILIALSVVLLSFEVIAELQNVEVGGSIRIRGNYINNLFNDFAGPMPSVQSRWSPISVMRRPIGNLLGPGVNSIFSWDNDQSDLSFVEQRTRLHVKADFTDEVSTYIELDSYDVWGEDFRSQNYITGVDARQNSIDDVEIFQAYIEVDKMWGTQLQLRVGRQELSFGSQFLVGPRDFAFFWTGISFDAIRLTYKADVFTIDAWASKLFEAMSDFAEDDINFYGIYASCTAVENVTFDVYWMLLEDDRPIANDFPAIWGRGDYDNTMLHTVGIRSAGKYESFDFDAEIAYQFGEADAIGKLFRVGPWGDNDAEFDNWALKLDLGYTFDFWRQPRVFAGFRYFSGEDNRDISFWDFINPFYEPTASISFNRLFSNEIASGFTDLNNDLSNAWWVRVGTNTSFTDKIRGIFCVTYFETANEFERPVLSPLFPWWTTKNDSYLGTEVLLFLEYQYSQDLVLEAGWSHMFVGEGITDGQFVRWNGLMYTGGSDDDDADYVYAGCKIYF